MKKILFSAIAMLICGSSFAQLLVDEKRHYIGFSAGMALPQGNFASTDELSDKAQYAKSGYNVNIEGAGYFLPFLGVAGTVGAFSNPVNTDDFQSSTSTVNVNNWANGYFMDGPFVSLPLGKFTIDGRVLFGAVGTKTPNIEVDYTGGKYLKDEKFVVGFGYSAGVAVRFNLISKLALKLNCDYLSANQSVSGNSKTYTTGFSEPTSYEEYTDKVDVRNINVGLGLVFQFVD